MDQKFEDLPLNPLQSGLLENASYAQDLNSKQIAQLQEELVKLSKKLKKFKNEIQTLEQEIQLKRDQLAQAIAFNNNYERSANAVLAGFNLVPPYQVTFIYDKGKPIAVRIPKKAIATTLPFVVPPTQMPSSNNSES